MSKKTGAWILWLGIGGLLLGAAGVTLAQVSTHFDLHWSLLSGGGGNRSSTTYQVDDMLGQWVMWDSTSTGYQIAPGFWQGAIVEVEAEGDAYEDDDVCGRASTTATDGTAQTHTFHDEGDTDWVSFAAEAHKTYILEVNNVGANADVVVMLYDVCDAAPLAYNDNAFGPTVRLEWDNITVGTYYIKLIQSNPEFYGEGTDYDLSVSADAESPSAPRSVRAGPDNQTLVVQWERSPERDVVGYRVRWGTNSGGPYSGVDEVDGADATYYAITGLINATPYYIVVHARDFSGNVSPPSVEIGDIPQPSADTTQPAVTIKRPTTSAVYTTTVARLTISGECSDAGGNLSRVHVRNTTNGAEGWDYTLSGNIAQFSVESIALDTDVANTIEVTAYDTADNTGMATLVIHRLSGLNGAVVIVGGHDDLYRLQARIDYATNRAYRVFMDAGFGAEDIYYLSPTPQDADEDGFTDVTTTTTPARVHAALQWAAARVGLDVPFYLFMMDHGLVEGFCADGCDASEQITSEMLGGWLDELETTSGCNLVNVMLEACHSGSFVDQYNASGGVDFAKSISKEGRVIIVSTGRDNLAYASAQGAYFSDAFFSAVASSASLLSSFNYAKTSVDTTGNDQTPWLDDNGDGAFTAADGSYATDRYVASYFGSWLPEIVGATLALSGEGQGTIHATVTQGDEPLGMVWAAIYPPSFVEPTETTMELGIPLVQLQVQPSGSYAVTYSGFVEEGVYRVLIYAQDSGGNQALPKLAVMRDEVVYLPLIIRE
ncbi:MAG: fibronectin type III domain-containing protein [Anaerolineae bacterium]|nr:fibronectin type III domain-containing protein [Anaerolineae bacterium]